MKHPLTIILLGDIAAGKDTQAKLLAKKFHLKLIATGAFSRKIMAGRSPLSRRLNRVKFGRLAPSDIIQQYLKSEILNLKSSEGVLINGGKMPQEARLIYRLLRKQDRKILVIYLTIPAREIFKRLLLRRKLEGRADDDSRAVKNRIAYYKKIYAKTIKFWKAKGLLRMVDGEPSVPKVTKEIVKTIKNYYGAY